jgi:hypothetical protein
VGLRSPWGSYAVITVVIAGAQDVQTPLRTTALWLILQKPSTAPVVEGFTPSRSTYTQSDKFW